MVYTNSYGYNAAFPTSAHRHFLDSSYEVLSCELWKFRLTVRSNSALCQLGRLLTKIPRSIRAVMILDVWISLIYRKQESINNCCYYKEIMLSHNWWMCQGEALETVMLLQPTNFYNLRASKLLLHYAIKWLITFFTATASSRCCEHCDIMFRFSI